MENEEQKIQTLYVNNLNDKLPKEQLKEQLYLLFSRFGTILDVVALKTERMRGQAWISYVKTQSATDALNSLQGFEFFGKPLVGILKKGISLQRITYAKTKSNAVERFEKALQMDLE